MATLLVQHFQAPTGTRDGRMFDSARKRAVAELAGRTVWCIGGAAARQLCDRLQWSSGDGVRSEALDATGDEPDLPADVRSGDIVVLHHPLTAGAAEAIRQRGAHAVWHVLSAREAAPAVDAYVMTGRTPDGAQIVAALMPGAGVVIAKEMRGTTYRDVGWGSMLADVVRTDREECVGGTLHARPAVAPR